MALTGIPHGATDHLIHWHHLKQAGKARSWIGFLLPYLLQMLAYGLLWWISPLLSLLLFLLLTFYHFGQSELYYLELPETHWLKKALYVLWGGAIMSIILLGHPAETAPYLEGIVPASWLNETLWSRVYGPALLLMGLLWTAGMVYLGWQGRVSWSELGREVAVSLLLGITLHVSSLWVGFGLYFGLWHATKTIRTEMSMLRSERPDWNLKNWILQALPFSLISLVGLAVLVLAWKQWGQTWHPVFLFFVGVSMLTLPHMLTLERLYQWVFTTEVQKTGNQPPHR